MLKFNMTLNVIWIYLVIPAVYILNLRLIRRTPQNTTPIQSDPEYQEANVNNIDVINLLMSLAYCYY